MTKKKLRNVAIIAHVDHGKTTLVDRLLQETGMLAAGEPERALDSNELEKERGITILAKNTALDYDGYRINIVDTPGHADFGGEVERVISMVDSVLLLVDAVEGPMPQTRFVAEKAFSAGLNPILVVNKIDRVGSEPYRVIDDVFELFYSLDASDTQLDFPVVYVSALKGESGLSPEKLQPGMSALLDMILEHVPEPPSNSDGPLQMQISALDYSPYLGLIGIGRIERGNLLSNTPVAVASEQGNPRHARVSQLFGYQGLERVEKSEASAGDIICITGIENIAISDTLCDLDDVDPLPPLVVEDPTLTMMFSVNTSPFAGRDGDYLTSRQLRERLTREASHNVALTVKETDNPDRFEVSGRGELHLSVLIETMRREGYELAVSRPQVITKEIDGLSYEPYETLTLDIELEYQGKIMESLGERRGQLISLDPHSGNRANLIYRIPTRGLMGYRPLFLSLTSGTGIMSFGAAGYDKKLKGEVGARSNGVLVSNAEGLAVAYALFNLQNRGRLMISPNDPIYEGMVVGVHSRDNDLTVNPMKEKKLTNVRASGSDENILLTAPLRFELEQALEFIEDDELVEVTPEAIRIRKKLLKEHQRKRQIN